MAQTKKSLTAAIAALFLLLVPITPARADDKNRPKDWNTYPNLVCAELRYRFSKYGLENALGFLTRTTDGMDEFYADNKNANGHFPFKIEVYDNTFFYPENKPCGLTDIGPSLWNEAQFQSGHGNPEWALALYTWIQNRAVKLKEPDWQWHVNCSRMFYLNQLGRYEELDEAITKTREFSAGRGITLDPLALVPKGPWNPVFPDIRIREYPLVINKPDHVVYWQRWESNRKLVPIVLDTGTVNTIQLLAEISIRSGNWKEGMELLLWSDAWVNEVLRRQESEKPKIRTKRGDLGTIQIRSASLMSSCLATLQYPDLALAEADKLLGRFQSKEPIAQYSLMNLKISLASLRLQYSAQPAVTENVLLDLEKQLKPSPYGGAAAKNPLEALRLQFHDSIGDGKAAEEVAMRIEKRYKTAEEDEIDCPELMAYKASRHPDAGLAARIGKKLLSINKERNFTTYLVYGDILFTCQLKLRKWKEAATTLKSTFLLLEKHDMQELLLRKRVCLHALGSISGMPGAEGKSTLLKAIKSSRAEERQKQLLIDLLNEPGLLMQTRKTNHRN